MSSLIIFNVLHLLMLGNKQAFYALFWKLDKISPNNIKAIIIILEIIIGIIYTARLLLANDDNFHNHSAGKKLKICSLKDNTENTYFGKFSLLILTSISLPTENNIYSLIVYIIVQATIGIIFIYKDLFYINPILTLLKFNVYSCECLEQKDTQQRLDQKKFTIISKNELKKDQIVTIRNTNKTILKLGKQNESGN